MDKERAEQIKQMAEAIEEESMPLDSILDGDVIAGLPVRLTAGQLALLNHLNIDGFGANREPSAEGLLDALLVLSDPEKAISVCRMSEKKAQKVMRKWRDSFLGTKTKTCIRVMEFLQRQFDAMPDSDGGGRKDAAGWIDRYVDLFASQYGWSRHYILWELPIIAGARLQDRMAVREGIKEDVTDVSNKAMAILDELNRSQSNG